jgi:hypothetical protein
VIVTIAITGRSKETAKVLLERDARFLRDSGWVGIDGPEKLLNLLRNFPVGLSLDSDLRRLWCGDLL